MTCSLGMRSFVWIWTTAVSILNIWKFLENVWWLSPQWQHLTSVLHGAVIFAVSLAVATYTRC